jgi:hypothetical protein
MTRNTCHLTSLKERFSVASSDTFPAKPLNTLAQSRSSSKYGELEPAFADASHWETDDALPAKTSG